MLVAVGVLQTSYREHTVALHIQLLVGDDADNLVAHGLLEAPDALLLRPVRGLLDDRGNGSLMLLFIRV